MMGYHPRKRRERFPRHCFSFFPAQKTNQRVFARFIKIRQFFRLLQRFFTLADFPVSKADIKHRRAAHFGIFSVPQDLLLHRDGFPEILQLFLVASF